MAILNGTSGNDTLNGTADDDEINGLAGDDLLNGLDGNDTLNGGAGNDVLNGGAGDDTFIITGTSASYDQVNGGSGADRVLGGAGDDTFRFASYSGANTVETIDGGAGFNVIAARAGYDSTIDLSGTLLINIAQIVGDTGNDTITGSAGDDVIVGGAGNDILNGGAGDDTFIITGTSANYDRVNGGSGADRVLGGAGDDTFRFASYSGANTVETIDGGAGFNVIAARAGYDSTIDLSGTLLINIAQIVGDTGNDTITGSAGDDVIVGGAGNDILNGGAGDDTFIITGTSAYYDLVNGGSGADRILGGAGDDTFRFSSYSGANTVETIDGRAGYNVIAARAAYSTIIDLSGTLLLNIAQIVGDTGNDTITGSAGNDVIVGGAGNDILSGGAGDDTLNGGAGSDTLNGGLGNDTYVIDSAGDVISDTGGIDTVSTTLATYALASGLENLAYMGAGSFTGTGNSGSNTITGGAGADTLNGGGGNDTLRGGAGNDLYLFDTGFGQDVVQDNDVTPGNTDIIRFGAGIASSSVAVSRTGLDLTLTKTSESITIQNWFASSADRVERVEFADSTAWDAAQLRAMSNLAPVVATPIANQSATQGQSFDFQVPANSFTDADSVIGDTLAYGATLANGNPLPSWLSFSAATRTFSGTPSNGDTGTITVKVIATDSQGASAVDSFDLAISAATGASAPVNTVPGVQTINEDASLVFSVANGNAIGVADSDSASLAVCVSVGAGTLTLGSTPGTLAITGNGTGTITLAGTTPDINTALNGLTYAPVVNANGPVTLTVQTGDGGTSATGLTDTDNVTINITAVNDAPVATNLSAAQTYTEDTVLDLTDIVVSDVDNASVTARLTLSDTAAGTLSTATSGAVTSTFAAGVWTASGAIANVNALLAGVTFNPAANFNSSFTIATSVSDGVAAAITGGKSITGIAVNDAPVATNLSAAQTYTEDTVLDLTDIVVSDVDSASVTARLTLSDTAAGTLSTATSGAVTSTFAAGVWTASGAISNVNALLAGVTFSPAADYNANFTIGTSVSDGALAVNGSKAITGTAVNDAPVLNAAATPVLASVAAGSGLPTGAVGTLVSALVNLNPPVGGLDNVTDPDVNPLTGIALTATAGPGVWYYSINGGTTWNVVGVVDTTTSLLLRDTDRLYFQPLPGATGTVVNAITFQAWDQTGATAGAQGTRVSTAASGGQTSFSAATDVASITISASNNAPVLDAIKTPVLGAVSEDAATPGAVGTLVSALVDFAVPAGQVDNVIDPDAGALLGIAVTGLNTASGTWFFSTNNGGVWTAFGAVTPGNARLLAADASTRVYFQPSPDFNGTVPGALGFRAWDQTTGTNGGTADTTVNGGSTAFSVSTDTANITVTPVNDAPVLSNVGGQVNYTAGTAATAIDSSITLTDVDSANLTGATIAITSGFAAGDTLSFTPGNGISVLSNGNGTLQLTGAASVANYDLALESVKFSTSPGTTSGSRTVTFQVIDDQSAPSNQPAVTVTVATGGANNAPVMNTSKTPELNTELKNSGAPVGAVGTLVSTLVDVGGPLSNVIDADAGTVAGIAVTGLSTLHGSWFYSLNGGASWLAFGAVSTTSATLLAPSARVYFQPGANFAGTVDSALTFKAWDQSSGSNGATGVNATGGGGTAFSTAADSANVHIITSAPVALGSLNGTNGGFNMHGTARSGVGQDQSDHLAFAVSGGGDFNGDGFVDLMTGTPYQKGPNQEGVAYVIFGNTLDGGAAALNGLNPITLASNKATRMVGDFSARSGNSMASLGDVNGDGLADMAIGTVQGGKSPAIGGSGLGAAYVVFGGATGEVTDENLNGNGTVDATHANGVKLYGIDATGDADLNRVAAAGDFNGDGYADVMISAYTANTNGTDSGQIYIVYGNTPTALNALNDTNGGTDTGALVGSLSTANGIRLNGAAASDRAGFAIAGGGDINGDGYADIIIGAGKFQPQQSDKNHAYVVFGGDSSANLAALSGANLTAATLNGTKGFTLTGTLGSYFGTAVGNAGDVNGDGFDDIIVGAYYAGSPTHPGAAYVVFGHAGGFAGTINVDTAVSNGSAIKITGPAASTSYFGKSVAGAGDVNGDGFDDVIIGAPLGGPNFSGDAYIVFGKASWAASFSVDTLDGTNGVKLDGSGLFATGAPAQTGASVSGVGDINNDGFDDVLVGSPFQSASKAGDFSLVFGSDFGNTAAGASSISGAGVLVGGSGHTTITGSAGADRLIGGRGHDTLDGGGGADVLIGGAGDDTLVYRAGVMRIDGGTGFDTMKFAGSAQTLDFDALKTQGTQALRVTNVENIDLTGTGNNTLTLTQHDVLNLADNTNTLFVRGDAGDTVNSSGWGITTPANTNVNVGGVLYNEYVSGLGHLLIETTVTAHLS